MQKVLVNIFLIICVFSLLSCSRQFHEIYEDNEIKYVSSIVIQDFGREYTFPWHISLIKNRENGYLVPRSCSEFKKMILKIYPLEYKSILQKAYFEFVQINGQKRISDLNTLNNFEEYLDLFVIKNTSDNRNIYFLATSFQKIIEAWEINQMYEEEIGNQSFICRNDFNVKDDSLSIMYLTIVNQLTGSI